jgi:carbonic anhydrase
VSADKALGWLKNGNIRFIKPSLRKDGQAAKDRQRLTKGQYPHSIILSCSDSRVPPEVVFDQKLGEIFVIRVAGEVLDASTIASIEYAVEHLESNLIVVLGHESCGAIRAAHGTLGGSDAGSPWLNKLVADIHPRLRSFQGKPLSDGGVVEGWANAEGVAKDLVLRSQIVRDAMNTGGVKIQTALYHLGSGAVDFK